MLVVTNADRSASLVDVTSSSDGPTIVGESEAVLPPPTLQQEARMTAASSAANPDVFCIVLYFEKRDGHRH